MDLRSQTVLDSGGSLDLVKVSSVHDGDPRIASSTPQCNGPQKPAIAAKKPTRQWAAWTHQEEESFFTALRQVGKNFEKITRRVQTKNKDQVRHYYYRLVRRMKKLLGPELSLDAKNSKDTNAAMLRWWSLLEKYSCKASKLHLKPRRFKIFIEALENQLMKDRKKNVKKQPSLGENTSPMMPGSITNHNRPPSNDTQIVKLVLVDSQNIQKPGTGRGPVKRNVNIGVIRGKKGDSTLIKPTRQRRKQGVASSAAYKKWEKAAIAGVSLVADAAEHLERAATDGEFQNEQAMPENKYDDNNAQTTLKLKLQLFPIDDATQRSLEMDKHNPHLELTLSTRKKISSVMEHLNKKWGNSSAAGRQLMLFPYFAQKESLMGCQGWSQESVASAADVYMAVGSPPVFRLRYGWFSDNDFALSNRKNSSSADQTFRGETVGLGNGMDNVRELVPSCGMSINDPSPNTVSSKRFELTAVNNNDTPTTPAFDAPSKMNGEEAKNELIHSPSVVQWCKNDSGLRTINKEYEVDGPRLSNGATISQGEWADSLTNISIGDLLSEVSPVVDHNCTPPAPTQSDLYLHQTPFSCDSFDAAIAAHLLKHQKTVLPSTEAPQTYSIWDAEETCDAFAFQKSVVLRQEAPTSSAIPSLRAEKQVLKTSSVVTDVSLEELHGMDFLAEKKLTDDSGSDSRSSSAVAKDFSGLTDIYWPDSLGPLDVDLLTPKYHGDDLILSDSLSGFNRLVANSLDAFQNCSFFTGQEGLITRS